MLIEFPKNQYEVLRNLASQATIIILQTRNFVYSSAYQFVKLWSHEASYSRERPARVIARKSGHTGRVTRASFNQRVTLPRGSY